VDEGCTTRGRSPKYVGESEKKKNGGLIETTKTRATFSVYGKKKEAEINHRFKYVTGEKKGQGGEGRSKITNQKVMAKFLCPESI